MGDNIQQSAAQKCDGYCETCNINQRTYCAAQMSYYMQGEISQIKAVLARFCDKSDTSIILRNKIDENEENNAISEPKALGADSQINEQ